ncbi:MAG TPA: YciI family protein [Ramlibacter sp.]
MKFMIMVKATAVSEAGRMPENFQQIFDDMGRFHEELARAGVLLDMAGLQPSSKGWRIRYEGGDKRRVIDGPFTESKELVAGYTLIDVRSREEALEWTKRFPRPFDEGTTCEIEVRPLYSPEEVEKLVAGARS